MGGIVRFLHGVESGFLGKGMEWKPQECEGPNAQCQIHLTQA
jgi:hypothetical protein